MRSMAGLVLLLAACSNTTGPEGFDVWVQIFSGPNTGGCIVSWVATANDSGPLVDYQIGEGTTNTFWIKVGNFRGTTNYAYDHRGTGDITVRWIVSAGTYSEDKSIAFSCGSSWQEP